MHPDKRKAPQRKASCSQRAPAIAPLDRKLNLVNQLVSLIDKELRQPLVEIIAAGHHSVSPDLLFDVSILHLALEVYTEFGTVSKISKLLLQMEPSFKASIHHNQRKALMVYDYLLSVLAVAHLFE